MDKGLLEMRVPSHRETFIRMASGRYKRVNTSTFKYEEPFLLFVQPALEELRNTTRFYLEYDQEQAKPGIYPLYCIHPEDLVQSFVHLYPEKFVSIS